jgi:mannose-6-phosphate isomerase-like protein (cupin superfamily)
MTRRLGIGFCLLVSAVVAQDVTDSSGYVLAPGDGELLGPDRVILASPESGTQGGVLMLSRIPAGFRTSFHIHQTADEFFYILSGGGTAEFAGAVHQIDPGYTIFVPAGGQHKLSVAEDEPMEVLSFFDRPGFDGWFREAHERFFSKSLSMSLDECNEIGAKYDHVCVRD